MTTRQRDARRKIDKFLSVLFLPDELVELRFIESWGARGKKSSRVARPASWLRRREIVSQYVELLAFAKRTRANIYFGVCPRNQEGDAEDGSIRTVRCVWCDIDDIQVEDAYGRWEVAGVPRPSIVVNSGSGIHGYWLLERDLTLPHQRATFAAILPGFYRSFGGDHVQNLSRVLRLPETFNYKDARNGRPPLPCKLYACEPDLRYPLKAFSRWMDQTDRPAPPQGIGATCRCATESSADVIRSQHAGIATIVSQLEKPAHDRSRRDFAVVCDLLRLGLTQEEIWALVAGSSKFQSNGRPYFDLTVSNAQRSVIHEGSPRHQVRTSI